MTTERFTLSRDSEGNVEFTRALMEQTGWGPGTKLEWIDNEDGTVTVFEAQDNTDNDDSGE